MTAPQPVDQPRPHRSRTLAEQVRPTIAMMRDAIAAGDRSRSLELIDYADHEWAGLNFGFYSTWMEKTLGFLRSNGVTDADIEGLLLDLRLLVNDARDPGEPYDRIAELERYRMLKARLIRHLNAPPSIALATLEAWKECWRSIHDRDTDVSSGLLNMVAIRFGEATLEDLFRSIIGDRFDFRYARYDVSRMDWATGFEKLVHASIETQRGHLVGPGREGLVELVEHEDGVTISFEPCGTGGRTVAGDALSGTPSRHDAPYYYASVRGSHDFAWNTPGVCLYCTHCAMMTGKFPIERYGYPLRVVEPPRAGDPAGRCSWTIYRDLRAIPESYYRSLGTSKPGPDEPLGSEGRAVRAMTAQGRNG